MYERKIDLSRFFRVPVFSAAKAIVLQRQEPARDAVVATIPPEVVEEDRDKFVKLVLDEFENLHEGNAIRFGIRPEEFAAWQGKAK